MEQDLRTNFSFSVEEHNALMSIIQQSLSIYRQTEMFMWLQGDMQQFIPHETLIAAWGDISGGQLCFNVISSNPSFNSNHVQAPWIASLVRRYFDRWTENHCHPVVVKAGHGFGAEDAPAECSVMHSLKLMRSAVIHGIEDERGAGDCMYLAFHSDGHPDPATARRMTELILPFIDVTLRRVRRSDCLPEYRFNHGGSAKDIVDDVFGLSARELEVMNWVRFGKTNQEIGMILSISIFTVKNHLRRVFEKLNVVNRTQAVAKLITPQGNIRVGSH